MPGSCVCLFGAWLFCCHLFGLLVVALFMYRVLFLNNCCLESIINSDLSLTPLWAVTASLVHLGLILVLRAHRVVIYHVRLSPLSLRHVLMIGRWDFLLNTRSSHLSVIIDVLASLSYPCAVERPRSLLWLATARLLVTIGHVALIPAVVVLTDVTHLALVSNHCGRGVCSFHFGLLSSDFPNWAGVVFAKIDAIFIAVSLVLRGKIAMIHIVSNCIQLPHIVLHSSVILGLNSLRLLLDWIYSLRSHRPDWQLGQIATPISDPTDTHVSLPSIILALLRLNAHGIRRGEAAPRPRSHRCTICQWNAVAVVDRPDLASLVEDHLRLYSLLLVHIL